MAQLVERVFRPNPGPQTAFWRCPARVVGYGGAMGGGKSRAICEKALQYAMECPGVQILVARQRHTSIVETTRKTMLEEVLHPAMVAGSKASGGEDFIDLYTPEPGVLSRINFVGLEDPVRWFSAQIGVLIVDQVEECDEDTIVKLITRLRHPRSPVGVFNGEPIAGKVILSFNPENPGHWLMGWFFLGAERTATGMRKPELVATDARAPMGDCEFFFAKATDNPHLPPGYVEQTLEALPEHLRRRYLDGLWEFISGSCYFDADALAYYEQVAMANQPLLQGRLKGDPAQDGDARLKGRKPADPIGFVRGAGPLAVWKQPVRKTSDHDAHRYVIGVDTSSGGGTDWSGMQVVDVEEFEVVARWQGKLTPTELAVEAYRLGRIYNDALIVPEITGGWGFSTQQELVRLKYPRLYTRRTLDRLTKKWTDRLGWDTTQKTRPYMLDTLEKALRERELGMYDLTTLKELGAFVRGDNGKPAAQPGMNDDLVLALALAVTITVDMPRQLRKPVQQPHTYAVSSVTGY